MAHENQGALESLRGTETKALWCAQSDEGTRLINSAVSWRDLVIPIIV